MIEKHECQRKHDKGLHGRLRGTHAAADYAMGTAIGSLGLLAFAIACRVCLPQFSAALVLAGATVAWSVTAGSVWFLRKRWR